MEHKLQTAYISMDANAKTLLLFGGSVERRQEIISLLKPLENLSVYGALSEAEGMDMLAQLETVHIVLIGGRYTEDERIRIRKFLKENHPSISITEPGYQYPYSNKAIFENVKDLLLSL
jgi:hypothetical protein